MRGSGGLMAWRVMEAHQLFRLQRNHSVRPAVVITELDLVDARSPVLNDRANLSADQPFARQILKQRYYRMHFNFCHRSLLPFIVPNNSSAAASLLRFARSTCFGLSQFCLVGSDRSR